MNDFNKACNLLTDRKYSLKDISREAGIAYPTIKAYSQNPSKLITAYWINVHNLAQIYNRLHAPNQKPIYEYLSKHASKDVADKVYKNYDLDQKNVTFHWYNAKTNSLLSNQDYCEMVINEALADENGLENLLADYDYPTLENIASAQADLIDSHFEQRKDYAPKY